MSKHLTGIALTMALLWLAAPAAHADMIYNVTLDTPVLASNPSQGPFAVDFELNDGSTGDGLGNNTATITNFKLTGAGSSLGAVNPLGLAGGSTSGDLGSKSTLTDSSFFNDFNQAVTPGSSLSFTLDLTTNVSPSEAAGSPDQFSFTVYSNGTTNVASLLTLDITGPNPVLTTTPGTLGNGFPVPAPSAVPEPTSLTLFAVALASLAAGWGWQRRRGAALVDPTASSL